MQKQYRYLLQVNLPNGKQFKQSFPSYKDMQEYIMQRDFFFVTADYNVYDLAIKLKG